MEHGLRRERKPTQRALEMTDIAPRTRRRRRTKAEMAASRASATPSDVSTTLEAQLGTIDLEMASGQRRDKTPNTPDAALTSPNSGKTTNWLNHSDGPQKVTSSVVSQHQQHLNSSASKNTERVTTFNQQEPKPKRGRTSASETFPVSSASVASSTRKSRQESHQYIITHSQSHDSKTESQQTRVETMRSSQIKAEVEPELPQRRARKSTVNYAEPDLSAADVSTEETTPEAPSTPKRSLRAKRTRAVDTEPRQTPKESPASSSGLRRLKLRQPVRQTESLEVATGQDSEPQENSLPTHDGIGYQGKGDAPKNAAPPVLKRRASSPEEERPRKSLKLKLSVPGLKAPSKLRFSINSHDVDEQSSSQTPAKSSTKVPGETTRDRKPETKTQVHEESSNVNVQLPKHQAAKIAPVKLSRRAQAKADAKAFGKVRQATESANHDRLQETTYGGAASHYAPSAALVRPALDCGLFCLPEASRILAFASIAADSIESDDEENSDAGQQPELLGKWLSKGSQHCICNKPSLDDEHDTMDLTQKQSANQQGSTAQVSTEALQNADVAAVIPENVTLPLSIPPVNSIMSKPQGRRVSAFYNVLTGSTSPRESTVASSNSTSRHESKSASPRKTDPLSVPGKPTTVAQQLPEVESSARPRTGSHEERARWNYQALERVRRDAKEVGLPISVKMSYAQIQLQLEQHKMQHRGGMSERSSMSGQADASLELGDASTVPGQDYSVNLAGDLQGRDMASSTAYMDDPEDRLMRIIGDSVKATMSRSKTVASESPGARQQTDKETVHIGRRHSSGLRARRGPSTPAFEDP